MHYDMKKCGMRIRQLCHQSGYTQEVLASELNISRSVLSRIEAGTYACSVDVLAQISVFFNVPMDYFAFGTTQNQSSVCLKDDITNLIRHLERFKERI